MKARKSALVRFKTNITADNLSNFRIARAKARRTCRDNKRAIWNQYVSMLNSRTTLYLGYVTGRQGVRTDSDDGIGVFH